MDEEITINWDEELASILDTDEKLREHGIATLSDPFSQEWKRTVTTEKLAMLGKLSTRYSDMGSASLERRIADSTDLTSAAHHVGIPHESLVIGGALLLQASIDKDFRVPIDESDVESLRKQVAKGKRAAGRSYQERGEAAGVTLLDRSVLDWLSSQYRRQSDQYRIDVIQQHVDAGIALAFAVAGYRAMYTGNANPDFDRVLPAALFGIASHFLAEGGWSKDGGQS